MHIVKSSAKIKTDYYDFDIDVEVGFNIYHDGIGWYEFWGAISFDKGMECMEILTIKPLFSDNDTDEIRKLVNDYIDNNWDNLCEEICDNVDLSKIYTGNDEEE